MPVLEGLVWVYDAAQAAIKRMQEPFFRDFDHFMDFQEEKYRQQAFYIRNGGIFGHADVDGYRCQLLHTISYNLGKLDAELETHGNSLSEEKAWRFLEFISASSMAVEEPLHRWGQRTTQHADEMREALVECGIIENQVLRKLLPFFTKMEKEAFWTELRRRNIHPDAHVIIVKEMVASCPELVYAPAP